jgi:hypothetical protein
MLRRGYEESRGRVFGDFEGIAALQRTSASWRSIAIGGGADRIGALARRGSAGARVIAAEPETT